MEHAGEEISLDPSNLARAYERYVSAVWRGEDEEANSFAVWLEGHWTGEAPSEPNNPPDSENTLGPGGAGIHWYAGEGVVLGYVTSRGGGCYTVRAGETVPIVRAPWESLAMPGRGTREGVAPGEPEQQQGPGAQDDAVLLLEAARPDRRGKTSRPTLSQVNPGR
jgi:hypothetical protein